MNWRRRLVAGCFPRLGAGLRTVGATSFLGDPLLLREVPGEVHPSPKVWPNPQVPRADLRMSSENEVSQLRSSLQYDTDTFFSGTSQ